MSAPPVKPTPVEHLPVSGSTGEASTPLLLDDPWQQLRQFTAARIALGRTGVSLPTDAHLAFQLAHARARDAVHLPLNVPALLQALADAGVAASRDCLVLDSAAADRLTYLQRPDLGRRLSQTARDRLVEQQSGHGVAGYDLALVIGDGLSAQAVAEHGAPFMAALMALLAPQDWMLAPLTIVRQARVAVGDEIGELLRATMVVILIGERPGLSSPDSMGLYLTWMPTVGLTDASRNCISNVRPAGLDVQSAAAKLNYLLMQVRQRQLSGVLLKDESNAAGSESMQSATSFLLPGRSV